MTLTPTQLDDAEAIARAATQGEWMPDLGEPTHSSVWTSDIAVMVGYGMCQEDAAHIARFSPTFALELIAEVRRRSAEAKKWNAHWYEQRDATGRAAWDGREQLVKERDEARADAKRWKETCRILTDVGERLAKAVDRDWSHTNKLLFMQKALADARAALDAKTEGGGDE